jgi:hypothetical protein
MVGLSSPAGGRPLEPVAKCSAESVFGQRIGEQGARERAPGPVRIRAHRLRQSADQRRPPLGGAEVAREREHGGIVERGVAVGIAAGGVHEQRAANGRVALLVAQPDAAARAEGGNDELDVVSRSGTRLRSSRA